MRRSATILSVLALSGGVVAGPMAAAGDAGADPYFTQQRTWIKRFNCNSASPFGGPLRIWVDAWRSASPSDGLGGTAVELIATNPQHQDGLSSALKNYDVITTISYRNQSTGKRGSVTTYSGGQRATWTAVIRPGAGRTDVKVTQRISGIVMVRNFNTQTTVCKATL